MADYGPLYGAAGDKFNVDPLLLYALADKESDQKPNAVGPVIQSGPAKGQQARGIMQFLPGTAQDYNVDVRDPTSSIFGGARYFDKLMNQQGQDLPSALAAYGGTTPDSPYVTDIMNNYKRLQAQWSAPYKNFTPPPGTPDYATNQKGNPGQPAATVAQAPMGGPDASFTMGAPSTKTPVKGQAAAAPGPPKSAIADIPVTHDESGEPIVQPGAPKSAIADLPVTHDESGEPIVPPATQYMSSATSPGAQATGIPIAEGRVPGAWFQTKINVSQDPAQRVRIAADQLGVTPDSIIMGPNGRMAAVDKQGKPYYIEPQAVFNDQGGVTQDEPGGPWRPISSAYVSPYSRATPFREGPFGGALPNPATDLAPNIGGAIPNAIATAVSGAPAAAGGPLLSSALVGASTFATEAARRAIANWMLDPAKPQDRPDILTPDLGANALMAAGGNLAFRLFRPAQMTPGGTTGPGLSVGESPGRSGWVFGGGIGEEHPMVGQQQLPGQMWGRPTYGPPPRNPLLPAPPAPPPTLPPQAGGPAPPVAAPSNQLTLPAPSSAAPTGEVPAIPPRPGTPGGTPLGTEPAPAAAAVHDPFEGTGERSGPYAPTTPQESAAQPTHLAPPTMPILTRSGVENRADEIIRHFAQGGNTDLDERDLITPAGLPQRTGNGGLAALWRYMAGTPEGVNQIQNFKDRALAIRQNFTRNLVGTQEDLDAARGQRLVATRQAYNQAFGQGTTPVDAQPVVDQINTILQSPEGLRSDIAAPLRQIRDMFYERDPLTGQLPTDADGNPIRTLITDPERLYNVRRDINDSLRGPAATSTLPNARAAGHVMGNVLTNLDQTIASGAPTYPAYMQQYADASRRINAMEFLQGRNLTDANGNTTLAKVDGAIKAAEQQRGIDPRQRPADSLTDDQMNSLYMLRDDLRRQANETKGKALGSDTAQNFATSALANNLIMPSVRMAMRTGAAHLGGMTGNPLLELPMMFGEGAAERLLGGGDSGASAVRQAVIRRLLNEDGSGTRALTAGAPVGPPGGR